MLAARASTREATRRLSHLNRLSSCSRVLGVGVRSMSSSLTPYEQTKKDLEEEKSVAQRKVEAMTKVDPWMVYGSVEPDAPPELPENPSELSALDPADRVDKTMPDGTRRIVRIMQDQWEPVSSSMVSEKTWYINFMEGGTTATQNWNNPLMGWVSGSDPMVSLSQNKLTFNSASEAVYFAKKRGWHFIVDQPIIRHPRDDNAQYQDNFLPQAVAALVKSQKTECDWWSRSAAGTSHYQRPLKYHGDGEVPQHGPNGTQPPEKHVEGYYKRR